MMSVRVFGAAILLLPITPCLKAPIYKAQISLDHPYHLTGASYQAAGRQPFVERDYYPSSGSLSGFIFPEELGLYPGETRWDLTAIFGAINLFL